MDITYFLFISLSGLQVIKCSLPLLCTHRIENHEKLVKANPKLKDCAYVKDLYPICGKPLTVMYAEQPPYIVLPDKKGGDPIGLLPDMLKTALKTCCMNCTKLTFEGPVDHLERFKPLKADIFMPVQSSSQSEYYDDKDFLPMVDASQVSVFAKQQTTAVKSSELTIHMLQSVIATWPLFLISILMAGASGCVIWILDTWYNETHFPQRFPEGLFEGFWWGFVSMTTVGYGDRVPSSIIARLFSVIWIFLGITMFNMYTAVLTTALSLETKIFDIKDFSAVDMGSLESTTLGQTVIFQEHGNYRPYVSVQKVAEALEKDDIKGIALDANVARFYLEELKTIVPLIRQHHMVTGIEHSYGMLSKHKNFTTFIKEFLKTNSDLRRSLISYLLYKRWPHMKHIEVAVPEATFFNYHSPMFMYTIISLVFICIGVSMIGLIFRRLFNAKIKNSVSHNTIEVLPRTIELQENC